MPPFFFRSFLFALAFVLVSSNVVHAEPPAESSFASFLLKLVEVTFDKENGRQGPLITDPQIQEGVASALAQCSLTNDQALRAFRSLGNLEESPEIKRFSVAMLRIIDRLKNLSPEQFAVWSEEISKNYFYNITDSKTDPDSMRFGLKAITWLVQLVPLQAEEQSALNQVILNWKSLSEKNLEELQKNNRAAPLLKILAELTHQKIQDEKDEAIELEKTQKSLETMKKDASSLSGAEGRAATESINRSVHEVKSIIQEKQKNKAKIIDLKFENVFNSLLDLKFKNLDPSKPDPWFDEVVQNREGKTARLFEIIWKYHMLALIEQIWMSVSNTDSLYNDLLMGFSYYAKEWPSSELNHPKITHLFLKIYEEEHKKSEETLAFIAFEGAHGGFGTSNEDTYVSSLITALSNQDPDFRKSAADALGAIGPVAAPAIPALIIALSTPSADLRKSAVDALGKIGPLAITATVGALGDHNPYVREGAAKALGLMGADAAPAVSSLIIVALTDQDLAVRCSAIEALGAIGPVAVSAVPALIKILSGQNSHTCEIAKAALQKIGSSAIPALITEFGNQNFSIRLGVTHVLGEIGPTAIPALIGALGDKSPDVRRLAAHALGEMGSAAAAAVSVLMKALEDENPEVRWSVAHALGEMGEAAVPSVPKILENCRKFSDSQDIQNSLLTSVNQLLPCNFTSVFESSLAGDFSKAELVFDSQSVELGIQYMDESSPVLLFIPLSQNDIEKILSLNPRELSGKANYTLSKEQIHILFMELSQLSFILQSSKKGELGKISLKLQRVDKD